MQKGFSLIEVMIVIVILGIVTAIGLMNYMVYIKKTAVSIGLVEITSLKIEYEMAVNERYSDLAISSNLQLKNSHYCNFSATLPEMVTKVAEKALICTFKNTNLFGANTQIYLTRDAVGQYSCHAQNIEQKYLPENCTQN